MEKPSWTGAPAWANYMAQDCDGVYYFYNKKPIKGNGKWLSECTCAPCNIFHGEWARTLEVKPEDALSLQQVKGLIASDMRNLFYDLEKQCNVEIIGYSFQESDIGYGYAAESNWNTLVTINLTKLIKPKDTK